MERHISFSDWTSKWVQVNKNEKEIFKQLRPETKEKQFRNLAQSNILGL